MSEKVDANSRDAVERESAVTLGAAAIVDIWMGGDTSWRVRLDDSEFLESADWERAREEARAAIAAQPKVDEQEVREVVERLVGLLGRYRTETPPGHSPHMICHLADGAIAQGAGLLERLAAPRITA